MLQRAPIQNHRSPRRAVIQYDLADTGSKYLCGPMRRSLPRVAKEQGNVIVCLNKRHLAGLFPVVGKRSLGVAYAADTTSRLASLASRSALSILGTGFGTAGPCPTTSRVGAILVSSFADSRSFVLSQVAIWANGKRR